MATLPGGTTVATIGLTAQENQLVSTLLQESFVGTSAPQTVTVDTSTVVKIEQPAETPVIVGTFSTTVVQSQSIVTNAGSDITVLDTGSSTAGTLTNLVADDSLKGAILTNTSSNSVVAFIGGSNTSMVVGDAGTQFVDMSKSTQNATIVSGTGNDSVLGGAGNDQVRLGDMGVANGGSGADTLIGGTGAATLGGGAGADSIVAATGGGVLIGEVGDDTMAGGAGKDIFIYRAGDGSDVISGFNPAADTLALAITGVNLLDVINRATVSGGNTILTMDDGSTITLAGVTGININWFTIK